jgi:hypothetical protein
VEAIPSRSDRVEGACEGEFLRDETSFGAVDLFPAPPIVSSSAPVLLQPTGYPFAAAGLPTARRGGYESG